MAKKIVEVDEDLLKGMMTSDIPLYGRDTERKETEPAPKKAATAEPENISASSESEAVCIMYLNNCFVDFRTGACFCLVEFVSCLFICRAARLDGMNHCGNRS